MSTKEARLFVARFILGEYTPEEYQVFLQWLEKASLDELSIIADEYEALYESWALPTGPSSEWVEQLEQKLDRADRQTKLAPARRMFPKMPVKRVIGVAAILLLSTGTYVWYHLSGSTPGSSKKPVEVLSNISSTPRGQQQELVLADGSKVWLNAASSLKYPASFMGKERTVELSGEAYFEVAKNATMPFRVLARDMEIEVLGTHFNVKAYADAAISKISLLEGSVRIARGSETAFLRPGEQAETVYPLSGAAIKVIQGTDPESVLAWKNGFLKFDHDDLRAVMGEVSRCYNVDIQYIDEEKLPVKYFSGKFSRTGNIHEILKMLEFQHIHSKIEGKIIKVMP